MEELAVVDRMAQEENISLTGQEEDDIKNLSSEFFQSLSNEDLNYLQITEMMFWIFTENIIWQIRRWDS